MGITEFLLARIAEDEAAAQQVLNSKLYFQQLEWGWFDPDFGDFHPAEYGLSGVGLPKRVLAECEAKRRIVEHILAVNEGENEMYDVTFSVDSSDVLRLLALPYAEHPSYDESWRP